MTNKSSDWTTYETTHIGTFRTVIHVLLFILVLFIIVGNSVTIIAICRFKHLRIASYVMIGVLSVCDFLIGTLYIPLVFIRIYKPDIFEHRGNCLVLLFFGQLIAMATVASQSTLSLERFYAVQFPYHYHSNVTVRHNLIWCIVLHLGLFIVSMPVVCGIDTWYVNETCYGPTLFPKSYALMFAIIVAIFLVSGLLAFVRVLVAEFKYRQRDRRQELSDVEKQSSAQSTLMILAYSVSVCLCLPHVVYYMWGSVSKDPRDPVILETVVLFDACNSAVNCIIYGLKNKHFKTAYKRLLGIKSSQVE